MKKVYVYKFYKPWLRPAVGGTGRSQGLVFNRLARPPLLCLW